MLGHLTRGRGTLQRRGDEQTYGKPMVSQSVIGNRRARKVQERRFNRSDKKERLSVQTMKAKGEWRGWMVACRRVVVIAVVVSIVVGEDEAAREKRTGDGLRVATGRLGDWATGEGEEGRGVGSTGKPTFGKANGKADSNCHATHCHTEAGRVAWHKPPS